MRWTKDPFKRFFNLYTTLILIGVFLLLFTRETINEWAIENSAIPLLEAEASYLIQAWEEYGPEEAKMEYVQEQDLLFKYHFKDLIDERELKELNLDEFTAEEVVMGFEYNEKLGSDTEPAVYSLEIMLPIDDKWQPVVIAMDQALFKEQTQAINILLYAVAAIMLLGVFAAHYMIRDIKSRLTDINTASTEIRQVNDLQRRINNDNLTGPLAETIGEINEMLQGLEASADKTRQQANNIAHDLRTPLTSVYQRLQTLSNTNPELEEIEKMMEKQLSTFNLLLKINRLESHGEYIELKVESLANLVEDVSELYLPVIEDHQQTLTTDIKPHHRVLVNPELLFHMLSNLLDNACKFNCSGGEIAIKSKASDTDITLTVADQSGGVEANELEKLSEKFYRSDKSRHGEGSGLGLSLVAAATEKMSGRLRVKNEPLNGKLGLSVSISFPQPTP